MEIGAAPARARDKAWKDPPVAYPADGWSQACIAYPPIRQLRWRCTLHRMEPKTVTTVPDRVLPEKTAAICCMREASELLQLGDGTSHAVQE